MTDHSCRRFDSVSKRLRRVEKRGNGADLLEAPELEDIEVVEQRLVIVEQRVERVVDTFLAIEDQAR